jgi:hypothetical protein
MPKLVQQAQAAQQQLQHATAPSSPPSYGKVSNSSKDHATPNECLPLPHSPTPHPPIRRIARPPTPQLFSRFDLRAMHARTLLPAALASEVCISSSSILKVQGEFDISEGASAKWIFDVEIENFRADFCTCPEDQNHAWC